MSVAGQVLKGRDEFEHFIIVSVKEVCKKEGSTSVLGQCVGTYVVLFVFFVHVDKQNTRDTHTCTHTYHGHMYTHTHTHTHSWCK